MSLSPRTTEVKGALTERFVAIAIWAHRQGVTDGPAGHDAGLKAPPQIRRYAQEIERISTSITPDEAERVFDELDEQIQAYFAAKSAVLDLDPSYVTRQIQGLGRFDARPPDHMQPERLQDDANMAAGGATV